MLGRIPDLFWIGPGFAIVVSSVVAALFALGYRDGATTFLLALTLMFVGPHYAATYRRAFSSMAILRAHPFVTVAAPLALLVTVAASIHWPTRVGAPFFATYVLWSGYHYSGQSLGLALLFPLRRGDRLSKQEKRLVALPLYASWVLSIVGLFTFSETARNPAYTMTAALARGWWGGALVPVPALAMATVAVLGSLSSLALLTWRRRARGRPLPAEVWAVVCGQLIWFCIGAWNPFFNIALVPIFHAAQYLALTSWHQTRGTGLARFCAYALTVLLLGLAVNPGLISVGMSFAGGGPVVVAAILSGINLHHFLMDGRIWRLRDRSVAASFVAASMRPTPSGPGGGHDEVVSP